MYVTTKRTTLHLPGPFTYQVQHLSIDGHVSLGVLITPRYWSSIEVKPILHLTRPSRHISMTLRHGIRQWQWIDLIQPETVSTSGRRCFHRRWTCIPPYSSCSNWGHSGLVQSAKLKKGLVRRVPWSRQHTLYGPGHIERWSISPKQFFVTPRSKSQYTSTESSVWQHWMATITIVPWCYHSLRKTRRHNGRTYSTFSIGAYAILIYVHCICGRGDMIHTVHT